MMMVFISILIICVSCHFFLSLSPLIMCMNLFIMIGMTCFLSGLCGFSYWFSYILFLVFMGGLMVLYMYIISLIPNELLKINYFFLMVLSILFFSLSVSVVLDLEFYFFFESGLTSILSIFGMNLDFLSSVSKLYMMENSYMFIFIVLYLLMTLYVVVNMTSKSSGPMSLVN